MEYAGWDRGSEGNGKEPESAPGEKDQARGSDAGGSAYIGRCPPREILRLIGEGLLFSVAFLKASENRHRRPAPASPAAKHRSKVQNDLVSRQRAKLEGLIARQAMREAIEDRRKKSASVAISLAAEELREAMKGA